VAWLSYAVLQLNRAYLLIPIPPSSLRRIAFTPAASPSSIASSDRFPQCHLYRPLHQLYLLPSHIHSRSYRTLRKLEWSYRNYKVSHMSGAAPGSRNTDWKLSCRDGSLPGARRAPLRLEASLGIIARAPTVIPQSFHTCIRSEIDGRMLAQQVLRDSSTSKPSGHQTHQTATRSKTRLLWRRRGCSAPRKF
jgi:hypothetical protein